MRPLAIDLFTGMHGWASGFVAEGWEVVGFDIEDMCGQFGEPRPAHIHLVLQDVLSLHGRQFKDAHCITASPPCQFFSYVAMPWTRAKALAAEVRADPAKLAERLALFNACFRIQREACEAAGRHIPLIVENVRGAQKWVGRARWNFGSFYLYGDVPALMPQTIKATKVGGMKWYHPDDPRHVPGQGFNTLADRLVHTGSTKIPGFRFDGSGKSFQSAAVEGVKFTLKRQGDPSSPRDLVASAHGQRRKEASALIAKIPLPLSRWIAATYYPRSVAA